MAAPLARLFCRGACTQSAQHLFTHNCELRGCALIDSLKFKGTPYKYKVQILLSIMRDTSNLIQEYEGQNIFSLILITCTSAHDMYIGPNANA